MKDLELKCENVLKKLYQFSNDLFLLGKPIIDSRLSQFENQFCFQLPFDFKYILTKHNSFSLAGTEVYGIGKEFKGNSLDSVYLFEHEEVGNPMLNEFLPFSPDGRGNHYCIDLNRIENNICPVVFWQHDFSYLDKDEVETCNDSFIEWIEEVMIEWNLETMNAEGI